MNVEFTAHALEDLAWFIKTDPRLARRIIKLIEDVRRSLFDGVGKPEATRPRNLAFNFKIVELASQYAPLALEIWSFLALFYTR